MHYLYYLTLLKTGFKFTAIFAWLLSAMFKSYWKLQKYHWVFICSIFSAANALFFYSTALLFFELLECFGRFSEKQFIIETFYPGTEGKQKASIHAWYMAICITYSSREKLQIANRAYVAQCSYHHNACSMPCMIMFRSPTPPHPTPHHSPKGEKEVKLWHCTYTQKARTWPRSIWYLLWGQRVSQMLVATTSSTATTPFNHQHCNHGLAVSPPPVRTSSTTSPTSTDQHRKHHNHHNEKHYCNHYNKNKTTNSWKLMWSEQTVFCSIVTTRSLGVLLGTRSAQSVSWHISMMLL